MKRAVILVSLLLGLLFVVAPTSAQKSYRASEFASQVHIEEGGDLKVQESITFEFSGGPFSFVYRELPLSYTDGVEVLSAGVDGEAWPAGSGPGQVEVTKGDPLRVTWHLAATSNENHAFELNYRMRGVVRLEQSSDLLRFRPLPDSYEYNIAQGEVVISYPASTRLLDEPRLNEGSARLTSQPGLVEATTGPLAPNTGLEIELTFPAGSFVGEAPQWQKASVAAEARRAEQNEKGVYWLMGSAVLLLVGAVGAYLVARPYYRPRPTGRILAYELPDQVAPAIVGVLRTISGSPSWPHALGTLFDLANRGIVAIEEIAGQKWYQRTDFQIHLLERPTGLWPHEQALLDLIFQDRKGRPLNSIHMSQLSRRVTSSRWKLFKESLEAELKTSGLWSKEQERARNRIVYIGIGILLLMVLCLPLVIFLVNKTGLWSISLLVSLALVSIAWIVTGSVIPIWSEAGRVMADEWEPFYRYIRQVGRGKIARGQMNEFELYLPYAAAYGQLDPWVKRFKKEGWTRPPAYFRSLADVGSDSMAVFAIMAHSAGTSGGSAAGGAGAAGASGGAAGGGASGAG